MRPARTALLVLPALLVLLVGGCGDGDGGSGLAVHEVPSERFSIGTPPDWRAMSVDEPLPAQEADELERTAPELAPIIDAVSSPDSPVAFFAAAPEVEDDFATNANVLVTNVPETATFDELTASNRTQLENLPGLQGGLEEEILTLPAGEAQRMAYTVVLRSGERERRVRTVQYALLDGDRVFVVTFSTLPALAQEYAPTFTAIAESLRLEGG